MERQPVYLLAGGRSAIRRSPDPLILNAFGEKASASPRIAYVGTANGDSVDFFNRMAGIFREAGAGDISHALIAPDRADLASARQILNTADIVFISGGDVERGMQVLEEKNMADFLVKLHLQDKPFFGLSAGSIMLAKEWVRWRNPDDDATAEIFPCLGIAPVICDTHGEPEWEELKALLQLEPASTPGYGINSGTAIKVFPDGHVEALGGTVNQYIRQVDGIVRLTDILPAR